MMVPGSKLVLCMMLHFVNNVRNGGRHVCKTVGEVINTIMKDNHICKISFKFGSNCFFPGFVRIFLLNFILVYDLDKYMVAMFDGRQGDQPQFYKKITLLFPFPKVSQLLVLNRIFFIELKS